MDYARTFVPGSERARVPFGPAAKAVNHSWRPYSTQAPFRIGFLVLVTSHSLHQYIIHCSSMQCRCTFITCCSSTSPSTRIYAYKTSHVYDAILRPMTAKKIPLHRRGCGCCSAAVQKPDQCRAATSTRVLEYLSSRLLE